MDALQPYTKQNGGLLTVEHVTYVEGRGNLIIEYDNVSPILCADLVSTTLKQVLMNHIMPGPTGRIITDTFHCALLWFVCL